MPNATQVTQPNRNETDQKTGLGATICLAFLAGFLVSTPFIFFQIEQFKSWLYDSVFLLTLGIVICGFLFVTVYTFRQRIIKAVYGRVEGTIDAAARSLGPLIEGLQRKDFDQVRIASLKGIREYVAYKSWLGFYRWLLGIVIAFIVALAGTLSTLVIVQQNEISASHADLVEFEQLLQFRDILSRNQNDIHEYKKISTTFFQESVSQEKPSFVYLDLFSGSPIDEEKWWPHPNDADVATITAFATLRSKKKAIELLRALARDISGTVALGAVLALQELGDREPLSLVDLSMTTMLNVEVESLTANKIKYDRTLIANTRFQDVHWEEASFDSAVLYNVTFIGGELSGTFRDTILGNVTFKNVNLKQVRFESAVLLDTEFDESSTRSVVFQGSYFGNVSFPNGTTSHFETNPILRNCRLSSSSIKGAHLEKLCSCDSAIIPDHEGNVINVNYFCSPI